jgi:hypothetical protein
VCSCPSEAEKLPVEIRNEDGDNCDVNSGSVEAENLPVEVNGDDR